MKIQQFSDGLLGIYTMREDIRVLVCSVHGVYRAWFTDNKKRNYLVIRPVQYYDRVKLIADIQAALEGIK